MEAEENQRRKRKEETGDIGKEERESKPPWDPRFCPQQLIQSLLVCGAHLVIHPIQQPWDHREDGGAESLHVI